MPPLICLTSLEELALRQVGGQSISIAPDSARQLVRLALAEPYRDGRNPPPVIDNILDRAIPLARAGGIPQPEGDDAE